MPEQKNIMPWWMDKSVQKAFWGAFIFLASFRLLTSFFNIDPDFNWHLRTGQLIWQEKQIPRVDWYSFSMPDFSWVDHEWLSEVITFLLSERFGYLGLIIIFYLLAIVPFWFMIRDEKLQFYAPPLFWGLLSVSSYAGVRIQEISWLFVYLLTRWLFENDGLKRRTIYFLPVLFAFWANLHGGFLLGLAIFFMALCFAALRLFPFTTAFLARLNYESKNVPVAPDLFRAAAIFLLSVAATLFNPYGARIYEEIFRTMNDPFLRQYIAEWQPLLASMNWPIIIYLGLFIAFALHFLRRLPLQRTLLSFILLAMALMSTRHFPFFVIVSLPLAVLMTKEAAARINIQRFFQIKNFALIVGVSAVLVSLYWPSFPFLTPAFAYPEKGAVEYLRRNPDKRTFNEYGWGGMLIGELSGQKFFIDGRMPSWRQDKRFAFGDYVDVVSGRRVEEVIKDYDLTRFVIRNQLRSTDLVFEKQFSTVSNLFSSRSVEDKDFDLVGYLIGSGWRVKYFDQNAVILEK